MNDFDAQTLFNAPDYAQWGRRLFRFLPKFPDAVLLFDSTTGEPAELLKDDICKAYKADLMDRMKSTFGGGNPWLIDRISKHYNTHVENILCTTGCMSAIQLVCKRFLDMGSHVIVEKPAFQPLAVFASDITAEMTEVTRCLPDFHVDPETIRQSIRPNTKLIILTNLHNPSGNLIGDAGLVAIARMAESVGALVVVDEVYGDFVDTEVRSGPAANLHPSIISTNSLTKVYGLNALKCGWMIATPDILDQIRPVYASYETGLSKITHGYATLVFDHLEAYEEHFRTRLAQNRPHVMDFAEDMIREGLIEGDVPAFGNMYFPRLVHHPDTLEFCRQFWLKKCVILAPGEYFNWPGHVRIGFASEPSRLIRGLELLRDELRQ